MRSVSAEIWAGTGVALCLVWVYWPTLAALWHKWGNGSQYSHGYLVPLFSLYLLHARKNLMDGTGARPSWWGGPVLLLGLAFGCAGTYLFVDWFNALSLLPCLAGLAVLVGGWRALRWSWPAIAFLIFMIPLPFTLEVALAHPLQRIATLASTFVFQTLGFAAFSEGNIIRMGEVRIGVVEACSGLSMLLIFFALSTAVAILLPRPFPEKIVIFLSAVPIALLSNMIRIVATGILHKTAGAELANIVFHDLAGWLMMPLALGFLWIEFRLLSWILLRVPAAKPSQDFAHLSGLPRKNASPKANGRVAPKPALVAAGGDSKLIPEKG
jgi:exosortase